MANGITDTFASHILTSLFIGGASAFPAYWEVALLIAEPSASGHLADSEITGGGYARIPLPVSSVYMAHPSLRSVRLNTVIQTPKATSDWGTAVAVGLYYPGTNDLAAWTSLDTPLTLLTGDKAEFAPGDLTFNFLL